MNLHDLLGSFGGKLTAADRRLVDAILADPRETAFCSTNEIAKRAAVHPTSAVRLARKLGFDGYPELRAHLRAGLFGMADEATRVQARIKKLGKGSVLTAFVESEIRALNELPKQVADTDIAAAARAVLRARQVFLFAVGQAGILARFLELRLSRAGYYRMHVLKYYARDLAAALLHAHARDVFILFAFNVVHPRLIRIVELTRTIGATSVVISDIAGLKLRPGPDVMLAASRGVEGEARSLAVPMAICNTLILQIARLDRGKTVRNLEKLEALRAKLD